MNPVVPRSNLKRLELSFVTMMSGKHSIQLFSRLVPCVLSLVNFVDHVVSVLTYVYRLSLVLNHKSIRLGDYVTIIGKPYSYVLRLVPIGFLWITIFNTQAEILERSMLQQKARNV